MVRKHRRRTRKRNKRGGSIADKWNEGVQGLKDIGTNVKARVEVGREGIKKAADDVALGYNRTQPGGMLGPVPGPPSSPPPMDPVKEKQFSLESPYKQSIETNQPTKEKQGGLLGLGWFGLGGRRHSHSAFINKMLRVRSKSKRNKSIRKYLKGGKKKTKKRKASKKHKTKRRRRKRR
uniref:Uncharacterized protein n=1 Tax=viral metagenome TaxID=1070528 RepID=A0A6C0KAY2_9ZZZZ